MRLNRQSPCKVNLVLNILGKRADGFHELETLFLPVPLHDELTVEESADGISLSCSNPQLPIDRTNLVWQAADRFLARAGITRGVAIHLDKRLPLAAGIGAGSANAAVTLLLLNELFGFPLANTQLDELAAGMGSDINFFLQPNPALAFGRGERISPLPPFPCLRDCALVLVRPGFGVPTPWAFKELAKYPDCLNGHSGRAEKVARQFAAGELQAAADLYNSLETPVFGKFPILALYQEFFRANGALGSLMSGSGSTTFALFAGRRDAESAAAAFQGRFGSEGWLAVVTL